MNKDQQISKQLHPQKHRLMTPANFIFGFRSGFPMGFPPSHFSESFCNHHKADLLSRQSLTSGTTHSCHLDFKVSVQWPQPGVQSIATSLKVPSGLAGTTWTKVL